jgi:hypothetical protein
MAAYKRNFQNALDSLREAVRYDNKPLIEERTALAWKHGGKYQVNTVRYIDVGSTIEDYIQIGQQDRWADQDQAA